MPKATFTHAQQTRVGTAHVLWGAARHCDSMRLLGMGARMALPQGSHMFEPGPCSVHTKEGGVRLADVTQHGWYADRSRHQPI